MKGIFQTIKYKSFYFSHFNGFWWYLLRNWNSNVFSSSSLSAAFWWYLLRNWNLCAQPRAQRTLSFWWYLLRNWNTAAPRYRLVRSAAFDDTYWGIETRLSDSLLRAYIAFDDTYWGIETSLLNAFLCRNFLLMIPIEELKRPYRHPRQMRYCSFDDTYWGIETRARPSRAWRMICFWWYLLRNWNITIISQFNTQKCFWWYLLRNWNQQQKPRRCKEKTFDDTYWGIETSFNLFDSDILLLLMIPIEELKLFFKESGSAIPMLLMIPIEELKHRFQHSRGSEKDTFDDTYWGIETYLAHIRCRPWWFLLMIPIEELKLGNLKEAWAQFTLLMIPIEELKLKIAETKRDQA